MALVMVKNKFQVVIPQGVRSEIGVAVGDLFDARVEKGRIVLDPKSVVDRGIAESLADFQAGRAHGPFRTVAAAVASMKSQLAGPRARPRRRARPQ
jgi:bifunctional DNA-binding transcriptional regulator/antitoxin component of YhaV-PrlF toxin-antitoxin module